MPQSGVYVILNRATGACYVGSSIRLNHRKEQHFNALKRGDHPSLHLQRSFNKHGELAFIFHVLEIVIPYKDYLLMREQYWIDLLKPQYNSRLIASSNLGMKHSDETRRKQSEAAKKRPPLPQESILRGAEKRRGIKRTEEQLRRQSASLKLSWQTSRVLTDASRKQMSERSKAFWTNLTDEKREAMSENASKAHMDLRRSEESRKKQSETLRAQERKHTEETKQLMSERRKEMWERKGVTEEDRKRFSAQAKSAWDNKSEEEKAKVKQSLQNNGSQSEEARKKRSESIKAWWAARKAAQSQQDTEQTP